MRILVVDRDRSVTDTTVMVLKSAGFTAIGAISGEEAIGKATECTFDVLLTDVLMEPMNGVQIALAFLELQPSARVILFSGSNGAASILTQAAEAGHQFAILPKPIHPSELFLRLRGDHPKPDGGPGAGRAIP